MIHTLKIKKEYADLFKSGKKYRELRVKDRSFKIGDEIILIVYQDYPILIKEVYRVKIVNVFYGGDYGLNSKFVILSIK